MKEDSDTKNSKKEHKENSFRSKTSKFIEKLDFAQISENEHEDDKGKKESEDSKTNEEEKDNSHVFPILSDILGSERIKDIRSGKSKLLMGIGIFVGLLLIIFGAIMTMGSADRIADNVIFGEREIFSVFLILVGILLIACSFAYKFLGKSFFKGIDENIESYDKTSSDSTKNNIKKDNINRNNR